MSLILFLNSRGNLNFTWQFTTWLKSGLKSTCTFVVSGIIYYKLFAPLIFYSSAVSNKTLIELCVMEIGNIIWKISFYIQFNYHLLDFSIWISDKKNRVKLPFTWKFKKKRKVFMIKANWFLFHFIIVIYFINEISLLLVRFRRMGRNGKKTKHYVLIVKLYG